MQLESLQGLPNNTIRPQNIDFDFAVWGGVPYNTNREGELGFLSKFFNSVGKVVGGITGGIVGVFDKDAGCEVNNIFSGTSKCQREDQAIASQEAAQQEMLAAQALEQSKITAYDNFPANFVKSAKYWYFGNNDLGIAQEENWKKYAKDNLPQEHLVLRYQQRQNDSGGNWDFNDPSWDREIKDYVIDFWFKALNPQNAGIFLTDEQIVKYELNWGYLLSQNDSRLSALNQAWNDRRKQINTQSQNLLLQQQAVLNKAATTATTQDKNKKILLYSGIGLGTLLLATGVVIAVTRKKKDKNK